MLLLLALVAAISSVQSEANPLATVPVWTHTLKLPAPDNRVFVTDGQLVLDVQVGKPTMRPSATLPPDAAKGFASYLAASYPNEFGLDDLKVGKTPNLYVGPDNLALGSNYVLFLRRNLPKIRFKSKSTSDPVLITLDGRPVGLVMPMVMMTH